MTLDGKSLLTKLSNEEIFYLPDVKEIKSESFSCYTNIKEIYMPVSLEIIIPSSVKKLNIMHLLMETYIVK